MNVRDFWTILLKLLGIWLVIESFPMIPQLVSSISFLSTSNIDLSTGLYIAALLVLLQMVTIDNPAICKSAIERSEAY